MAVGETGEIEQKSRLEEKKQGTVKLGKMPWEKKEDNVIQELKDNEGCSE